MKIKNTLNNPSNISGLIEKEEKKVVDTRETSFQSKLRDVEGENFEERLNSLVNRIFEQGEKLGKKADIRELKIYKKLISEFLSEVTGNSHKYFKRNFLDRRGRHRVYAIIKKVDEELAELTDTILDSEKNNINILKKLDDIKGLILDLML